MSLVATVIAAAGLIAYKVLVAIEVGPEWDAFAFLSNAAEFAGKGTGYSEPHRPPLLPFLTSLVFRLGHLDAGVIQVVDGVLTLACIVAFYLLLRRAVTPWLAFAGSLGLLAVTPLWSYLGVGYTDTAAIGLSACALLTAIAATERDPRWYLALGPLFVAAVLMRFTALLFAFPIMVWLGLRWRPFRHAARLMQGAGLAVVAYVPAGWYYLSRFGDALFPFVFAFGITETVTAPGGEGGARAQAVYYLRHMPDLIAPAGMAWATVAILAIGACGLYGALRARGASGAIRAWGVGIALAGGALAVAAQFGAGLIARQLTIPIAVVLAWRSLAARDRDGDAAVPRVNSLAALDAAMVTWLLVYVDFHGHQTIQVPRYFITMAPPLIYLTARGWQWLVDRAGAPDGLAAVMLPRVLRAPVRASLAAIVCATFVAGVAVQAVLTPRAPDKLVVAARDSAAWLSSHDPDATGRIVYSDMWPLTSWYLHAPVRSMPFFTEERAFAHELAKSDARYFLTLPGRRFEGYRPMHTSGAMTVLERETRPAARLPRILYLGSTWDTYLEGLCGYGFYLESTAGRYGWEGTAFLDALPAERLATYDAVAVAGFRWRDRADGDAGIRRYLEQGGTVVADASQNLGGLAYSVADTIMFDTVIRRGVMPLDARLRVSGAFAARHPEATRPVASPWRDLETGGAWTGATYEERPGTAPLTTLVWADDRPVVQVERVGKGRIYWIGYNLVWHAFSHKNADEARLVDAVFKDALSSGSASVDGGAE